jgi:hypothetical protein
VETAVWPGRKILCARLLSRGVAAYNTFRERCELMIRGERKLPAKWLTADMIGARRCAVRRITTALMIMAVRVNRSPIAEATVSVDVEVARLSPGCSDQPGQRSQNRIFLA